MPLNEWPIVLKIRRKGERRKENSILFKETLLEMIIYNSF